MRESLSLRTRLLLPLGPMFGAALLLGTVSLQIFAPTQLLEENAPAARAAGAVAAALNDALHASANPQATLDAFVQSLGTSEDIRYQPAGVEIGMPVRAMYVDFPANDVGPAWTNYAWEPVT